MSRVRVQCFGVSLDGFGAGPAQDLAHPLGVGGEDIMRWAFPTRTLQRMVFGQADGTTGIDDRFAARGFENVGAWILGRNMFAPSRGAWPDDGWKGWWGEEPPYHVPTFVLTHHARGPIEMKGGTTFHFVTGGIREALDRAREAARGKDVRIGGGVSTVRQYLQSGLVDEMHLVVSAAVLGAGEKLLEGIDLRKLGLKPTERVTSETVLHVVLTRPAT
jgi:dihydrofolate reductase